MIIENIKQAIVNSKRYYVQLVILIENIKPFLWSDFLNFENAHIVNVGLELSTQLLDVPLLNRPKVVGHFFEELIKPFSNKVIFLQNLEILFDRSLSIDPLKLLKHCSKNTTLVIIWPGSRQGSSLIYATPNHPEYRLYKESELNELIFVDTNETHKEIT